MPQECHPGNSELRDRVSGHLAHGGGQDAATEGRNILDIHLTLGDPKVDIPWQNREGTELPSCVLFFHGFLKLPFTKRMGL